MLLFRSMTALEIITSLTTDIYTKEELSSISTAVRSAQDINKQRSVALMKATLKVGDEVTLSGLRPKSINGLVAKVVAINRTRAEVDMPVNVNAGRWSGAKGVVPLSCVTKV